MKNIFILSDKKLFSLVYMVGLPVTYVLLQNFLKIVPRNVLKIRFITSTSPSDEGRGRKVRYRSLFRAGPWCCSYLEPCETRVPGEGRAGGGGKNGKRYTRCRVGWAKMQGKVSRAKVVTYRLCQTPPISSNDLASKNSTFLGTLFSVSFFHFIFFFFFFFPRLFSSWKS